MRHEMCRCVCFATQNSKGVVVITHIGHLVSFTRIDGTIGTAISDWIGLD